MAAPAYCKSGPASKDHHYNSQISTYIQIMNLSPNHLQYISGLKVAFFPQGRLSSENLQKTPVPARPLVTARPNVSRCFLYPPQ